MVNSDLAINAFIELNKYYSSAAVRYTGVPNTIKRYGSFVAEKGATDSIVF